MISLLLMHAVALGARQLLFSGRRPTGADWRRAAGLPGAHRCTPCCLHPCRAHAAAIRACDWHVCTRAGMQDEAYNHTHYWQACTHAWLVGCSTALQGAGVGTLKCAATADKVNDASLAMLVYLAFWQQDSGQAHQQSGRSSASAASSRVPVWGTATHHSGRLRRSAELLQQSIQCLRLQICTVGQRPAGWVHAVACHSWACG